MNDKVPLDYSGYMHMDCYHLHVQVTFSNCLNWSHTINGSGKNCSTVCSWSLEIKQLNTFHSCPI